MDKHKARDKSFFEEFGCLVIDNAVSEEDIRRFKLALHHTLFLTMNKFRVKFPNNSGTLEEECDEWLLALRYASPEYPSIVQAIVSRSPEYFKLCSMPQIIRAVRLLLEVGDTSPIYLTNNGIIFTNPNDTKNQRSSNIEIGWHKDTFFTLPRSRFLQVWVPLLHDATKEIGTLQICAGSHKGGIGQQEMNLQAQYDHRFLMSSKEVSQYKPTSIELKLGQALVFDGNLIHRSGFNTSQHVRCTLIGMYHDAANPNFSPLQVQYIFPGQTPEEYFYEMYPEAKSPVRTPEKS